MALVSLKGERPTAGMELKLVVRINEMLASVNHLSCPCFLAICEDPSIAYS